MPDLTPPEVIKSAIGGNAAAFRTIVEQNQAFAYAVAFRFVDDEQEAEDIVQEAFIKLWKNLPRYRQEFKLTTWFYKIIVNLCLDSLKSGHVRTKRTAEDVAMTSVRDASNPEKALQQQEMLRAVHYAADQLTPKQKAVFVLRDLEGLTSEEAGDILSMSAGNIKSNLCHARQKVAKTLKQIYQTNETLYMS